MVHRARNCSHSAPVAPKTYLGRAISSFPDRCVSPCMQRWSCSVQRELPARAIVEAGHIGNRGTRLSTSRQIDATPRQYPSTSPERDQPVIGFLSAPVANPFYGMPEFAGSGVTAVDMSRGNLLPRVRFGVSGDHLGAGTHCRRRVRNAAQDPAAGIPGTQNRYEGNSATATGTLRRKDP